MITLAAIVFMIGILIGTTFRAPALVAASLVAVPIGWFASVWWAVDFLAALQFGYLAGGYAIHQHWSGR